MSASGTLVEINLAGSNGQPQASVAEATLLSGEGLLGDRYFGNPGVISLIEAEAVDAFNELHGTRVSAAETRRNLLTKGVRLNPLVGQTFWLGGIELHGMELCDPCATLGQLLATEQLTPAQVVRSFASSGGLRAYVRGSGTIRPGAIITTTAPR